VYVHQLQQSYKFFPVLQWISAQKEKDLKDYNDLKVPNDFIDLNDLNDLKAPKT